jgi:RNA 2',3'-cyclic 3'-phosphodiesterase
MGLIRTFIAAELPLPLQDEIQKATSGLRKTLGDELIRWVPPHNVHLTLKFLGDVSPASLDQIKQILVTEAAQVESFAVQVEGLGAYPNSRRPRVLWVGLNAPAALTALQHSIDAAAARLGFESEDREFSPHLTIGRVRQNLSATEQQKIRTTLEETQIANLGTARVDSVYLFKSDLQASGSIYTKLFSAPLLKT